MSKPLKGPNARPKPQESAGIIFVQMDDLVREVFDLDGVVAADNKDSEDNKDTEEHEDSEE